jgi:hypothetical protein
MDSVALVDEQIRDGQIFADLLVGKYLFDVTAAFWVKTSEEGRWFLYVASKEVDEKGLARAFRVAHNALQSIASRWVTVTAVRLVSPNDPIARDVLDTLQRFVARIPTVSHRSRLGDLAVEEVYIYPSVDPEKVWVRQAFRITYYRQGNANRWTTETERGEFYRGSPFKGAVSYSTAHWGGESAEAVKFATVSVLTEIDPRLDEQILELAPWKQILTEQARKMADEMFKSHHPEAEIEHTESDD